MKQPDSMSLLFFESISFVFLQLLSVLLFFFVCYQLYSYSSCFCQTDVDECASNPCSNALKCVDLMNDYACECKAGWKGSHCNESEYLHSLLSWDAVCLIHCSHNITLQYMNTFSKINTITF